MKNQTAIFLPGLLSLIKEPLLKIKRLELQLIHAAFMSRTMFRKQEESIPSLHVISGEFNTQDAVKKCFDILPPEA